MRIKDRLKPKLPPVPAGTYTAICVQSLDLGEQLRKKKDGSEFYANQFRLGFELVGQTIEIDGKQQPRVLGRTFNVSWAKNSDLRKFLNSWMARDLSDEELDAFDTDSLVGMAGLIVVVPSENGEYSNINGIIPLPVGMAAPAPTAPLVRFNLNPWNEDAFNALEDWAKELVRKSTQYQELHTPTDTIGIEDAPAAPPAAVPPQSPPPAYAAPAIPVPYAPLSPAAPAAGRGLPF